MLKKLNGLPKAAGVGILVVCVAFGVTAGNRNALVKAVKRAGENLPAVEQLLSERAGKASNLITLCERYVADGDATAELKSARDALNAALGAGDATAMQSANQKLSGVADAAQIAVREQASAQDQKLLLAAMDELRSSQLQLDRAAGAYNEGIAEAKSVYGKLPTRFLLEEPEEF